MTMNYEYSFTFQKWEVGSAFEVASPYTYVIGFGSVLTYLLLIFVVFPAMKPRGTQELTAMRSKAKIHYVLLCVYSGICSFSTLYHIYTTGEIYSLESYLCEPCPYWMRMLSLSFIFSKIWEWFDTAILIWNEMENFHGTSKSGMLLNGFVHFLMYYHYAFRLPRFMRPLITIAQIIQLAVVTYFWYVSPATCPAYADFPVSYPLEFNIPYGLVPVYLCFFLKFFFESYVMSPKKKST